MISKCTQLNTNEFVASIQKRKIGQFLDLGRNLSMSVMASLDGLDRSISSALDKNVSFGVPLLCARGLIADMPLLQVPRSVLHQRLPDWLVCGQQKVYMPNYFVCTAPLEGLISSLRRSSVLSEAKQLYMYEMRFREMPLYKNYLNGLSHGSFPVRNGVPLNTPQRLDEYFKRYVALFESIKQHGLLRQKDSLAKARYLNKTSIVRKWTANWSERDIGVALGGANKIVALPGGKHRAAIAMVLGLPTAPAQVRMVHSDWLRSLNKPDNVSWHDAILEGVAHLARSLEVQGEKCLTAG